MGAEVLEDTQLAELAASSSEAAGIDLRRLLVEATDEELRLTENAQPALCFMGIALALLLRRRDITPHALAGHSVGEYAALAVAGALAPELAIMAVRQRGIAMAEASPPGESSMAAVLGLGTETTLQVLSQVTDVWPANFNTPTQTVVAGSVRGIEAATPRLLAAGAKRVLPLNVSAAFHTPLMAPAAQRLRSVLNGISWSDPMPPVVANIDAEAYPSGQAASEILELQLKSPVRWADCVARLSGLGCDGFVELGPKRALTGMMRELAPGAWTAAVSTPSAASGLSVPEGDRS
jgi:[acyl-carrier-protein] S-malonyltransferase